jgi:SNF2 family DNA or RNA helicase
VTEIEGLEKARDLSLMLGSEIEVISYDLFMWLTENTKPDRYDAIIFDELSKMKHPGTKRFKRMKAWTKKIEIRIGLTGSPMGNHWTDVWGEMYTVAGEKPLGPTKEKYLETYFKQVPRGERYIWELRDDGSDNNIISRIRPYAFSIKKPPGIVIPETITVELPVELPQRLREQEARLRREFETELDSGTSLMALNQSKLAAQIRQFASGAIYTGETGDTSRWEVLHDKKVEALRNIVEEMQGEPLIVFTWFKHEARRLSQEFDAFIMGEHADKLSTVDLWNARKIPMLVLHPQGSGHGLNLQKGSSSVFWFTLPWSRELYDQGNGRLARLGQPDPFVTSYIPLAGPIDRRVWSAVMRKGENEKLLTDGVRVE